MENKKQVKKKFIDVERMLASKNKKLAKWMPGFIKNYLKRKTHQKEINKFLEIHHDKYDVDFCREVINKFNINVRARGLENIPSSGGCIFACNHPLGGMDAMALVTVVSDKRTDIKFIVNDLLLNLENLKNLFVGVNKHGRNSVRSLKEVDALFGTEKAVFVFPSGLVSRKKKGKVKDLEWKKAFITRSKKYKRNVIPVYLDGELSDFFYRLANFRKGIGVKANIEMLYLADEFFKQTDKTLNIVFGEKIPYTQFDKSKNDKAWAHFVKEKVYSLKKKLKTNN